MNQRQRVAKAIHDNGPTSCSGWPCSDSAVFLKAADAAISAMAEPEPSPAEELVEEVARAILRARGGSVGNVVTSNEAKAAIAAVRAGAEKRMVGLSWRDCDTSTDYMSRQVTKEQVISRILPWDGE